MSLFSSGIMMKTSDFAENKYFICVTKYGKIKRTPLYDFRNEMCIRDR